MNPFQIQSKKSWGHNAFCCSLLIVFARWKTKWTWNPKRFFFFSSLRVKMRALWENWVDWEQVWPPLNSLGELVCMHQWLTGSWAPDNHPLLQELLLHCWQRWDCIAAETHNYSHTVHPTESMLSPQRWLVVPLISWWCKFCRKWRRGSGAMANCIIAWCTDTVVSLFGSLFLCVFEY